MSSSTNQVIEGLGTHHIAVQTRDWEESLKLYQDVVASNTSDSTELCTLYERDERQIKKQKDLRPENQH